MFSSYIEDSFVLFSSLTVLAEREVLSAGLASLPAYDGL